MKKNLFLILLMFELGLIANSNLSFINKVNDLILSEIKSEKLGLSLKKIKNSNGFYYARHIKANKKSRIFSIGDLHGSKYHLDFFLNKLIDNKILDNNYNLKKNCYIVVTGDFLDRGPDQLYVFRKILKLYLNNPDNVLLLRGNHETYDQAFSGGFFDALNSFYDDLNSGKDYSRYDNYNKANLMFQSIIKTLTMLPSVGFISLGGSNHLMFMHASFNPKFDAKSFLNSNKSLIKLNESGYINHYKNPYVWGSIKMDKEVKRNPRSSRGEGIVDRVSYKTLFRYLKKHKIDSVTVGHDHFRDRKMNEYGVSVRAIKSGSKIIRHIQNFGPTPVFGYSNNRKDCIVAYFRSFLSFKMNKTGRVSNTVVVDASNDKKMLDPGDCNTIIEYDSKKSSVKID